MLSPVEEIKSKINIVDLIKEYVPLKQSGTNWKGLCPFHNEKTPSFMVSPDKQFFKCFGCGEGGDVFTFLQKVEGLEFPEALKILADKVGVELKQHSYNPQFQNLKTRLYELHQLAAKHYQEQLLTAPAGKFAREYLINQRGLTLQIINEFKIGYAPEGWETMSKFLRGKGFSDYEIKQSGLVVEKNSVGTDGKNYYDRFRDRIMFPIADHHGNIVGFTARAMKKEESAKYINTPQTVIYNKSQILFGLDRAKQAVRENGFIVLVEGNMDLIASHKAGVKNIVASSGTSLTEDQIRILKRYTNNVVICFDADLAGITAAERGVTLLWQAGMNVKAIVLPKNYKDPDELVSKNPQQWTEVINQKVNFMDYLLQIYLHQADVNNVDVKKKIAAKILAWVAKLPNSIEEEHYLRELSSKLNVDLKALQVELNKIKTNLTVPNFVEKPATVMAIKQANKQEVVSQRLLALAIYTIDYLEELIQKILPELIEQRYQPIYNELIVYYTKKSEFSTEEFYDYLKAEKPDLAFVFDTLKLLAEAEFEEVSRMDLNREFDLGVNYLKRENISGRLKKIEQEIRLAEQQGQRGRADELMREFSVLSRELTNL